MVQYVLYVLTNEKYIQYIDRVAFSWYNKEVIVQGALILSAFIISLH